MKTTPTRKRRSSAKADARRIEICDAAARLFTERGVDRVNMEEIADAVGLAKPSLYHYFRSKELILFNIQDEVMSALLHQLQERVADDTSSREKLLGVFADMFASMDTYPGRVKIFFENYRVLDDEHRRKVRDAQRQYEALVQGIIRDGIADGTFRDVDPQLASLAVFGVNNWAYHWYSQKGSHSSTELAQQFFDFLVNGIGSGS